MVLIHIKKTDTNQFIYSAPLTTPVEDLISQLVNSNSYLVNNLRIKADRLAVFVEELVKHGPLKPEDQRGLSENENSTEPPLPGHRYVPDEHHYRTGWCVPAGLGVRILETTQAAKDLVSKTNAERRISITAEQLTSAMELMKGAVMMAYPAYHGLPPWEPAILILENRDLEDALRGEDVLDVASTTLWFAGKEMLKGKLLSNFVKGTENTKIIAKLQKPGAGAPVREPLVDGDTQKQMVAWHHKKQEEAKKLMAEDEDSYLNSAWADPKGLKRQLIGGNNIRWRP
jgi:hypothetical protein